MSGGMHSDPGARMPVWSGELAQFPAVLPAVEEWQRGLCPSRPLSHALAESE